jgi:hypothetical protein
VYIDVLSGIILNTSRHIEVFVEDSSGETSVSPMGTDFMGGTLWFATNNSDIILYFQSAAQSLPFSALDVKVVFE